MMSLLVTMSDTVCPNFWVKVSRTVAFAPLQEGLTQAEQLRRNLGQDKLRLLLVLICLRGKRRSKAKSKVALHQRETFEASRHHCRWIRFRGKPAPAP